MPTFNKILTEKWDGHKVSNGWDATVHNFGLGSNDRLELGIGSEPANILAPNFRIVKLSKASIIGQSTFGMKETEGGEFEELQIRDASKAVGEVLRSLKDKTEVDLLHVNCEVGRYFLSNQSNDPIDPKKGL